MLTGQRKRVIFNLFVGETLGRGLRYWWRPRGFSMAPTICDGDRVMMAPADPGRLRTGDIVKFEAPDGFRMHRVIWKSRRGDGTSVLGFQGDNSPAPDPPVDPSRIVGVAVAVERNGQIERLDTWPVRFRGRLLILKRSIRKWLLSAA